MPVIAGSSLKATKLSNVAYERGINVQPIVYPAVEEKAARLRFFLSSLHDARQIETTIRTITEFVI